MFNKQEKTTNTPTTPSPAPAPAPRPAAESVDQKLNSIMGRGSVMTGTIKAEGSIRVDGRFDGTIESGDTLVVGKEGVVNGDAIVKRAVIGGHFEGNIHASVKVELHGGCEMFGEVVTPSLVIEEGVVFEGSCKMGSKSQKSGDMKSGSSATNVARPATSPTSSPSSTGAMAGSPTAGQRL
ncbi:MAG: polymer-forming cytoskeletal protein [bacterium]